MTSQFLARGYDPSKGPTLILQEQPGGAWCRVNTPEQLTDRPWFAVQGEENVADFSKFLSTVNAMPNTPVESPNQKFKLIFYVPPVALEPVKHSIFAVGGGTFPDGKYTHCSFEVLGTGQFLPEAEKGADPTIGHRKPDGSGQYEVERVEEVRCEIMCVGREVLKKSVEALKR